MRSVLAVFALPVLAACAQPSAMLGPGKDPEAVADYIVAGELVEVDRIRLSGQLNLLYVNEWAVVVPTKRHDYLVIFKSRCSKLRERKWTADMVDIRVSARILHADYDTIRGCNMGKIYELTDAQLTELSELADAPGSHSRRSDEE